MQIKTFTIRAIESEQNSTDELNSFLRGHRVVNVENEFVQDGDNSFWSVFVKYLDAKPASSGISKKSIDYREVLNENDFAIYARLRTLRKNLAEKEGVPAYALFTNEQLAEIVRRNISTKKTLSEINGIGKSRIDKYGDLFLNELKEIRNTSNSDAREEASGASSQPDLS